MTAKIIEPEFSRALSVEKIPSGGIEQNLTANEAERQRLVERFGLLGLSQLTAQLNVKAGDAGTFAVTGTMIADVTQQCGVTLEPLPGHIEQEIDALYAPPNGDEEDAEPIIDGLIDLGELMAQNLGTSLDPYPRKPGIAFVEAEYGGEAETGVNPFAKLVSLSKKTEE
jgi:hypothetical protein